MIFVTVGGQLPFDRMVRTVDAWAGEEAREDVFAQIGGSAYRPRHVEWTAFLEPREFRQRLLGARAIVAHAGMGTVLTALEARKPILIMPRRAALSEQRNDHQVATAERLRSVPGIHVALDEHELARALEGVDSLSSSEKRGQESREELLSALRVFLSRVREERR